MGHNYFNIQECPIEGSNLIEASAGTGKTYSIASLFLKALLEKRVKSVKNILVLTFTKAATAEIKLRIYENLLTAKRMLEETSENVREHLFEKEPVIRDILKPYLDERSEALKIISNAVKNFDENGIYTIHGFCNLILSEYAFSSGVPFDKNMVTDQSLLVFETIVDYWRKFAFFAPKCVMNKLEKLEFSDLISLYKIKESNPHIRINQQEENMTGISNTVENCYNSAEEIHGELAERLKYTDTTSFLGLIPFEKLKGNIYQKSSIEAKAEKFLNFISADQPLYAKDILDDSIIIYFTAGKITSSLKKNNKIDEMPEIFKIIEHFYDIYLQYMQAADGWLIGFKKNMIDFVHKRLNAYKSARGILYFNDQLSILHDALSETGDHFKDRIADEYQLVFVDEFQDTDPLQYEIIKKLFIDKSAVFFIGDPKQSIYSFRGADIYSYIKAKENVESGYTMKTNFRSESALVYGVNRIFNSRFRRENPFVIENIGYSDVDSENKGETKLIVEGEEYKPLKIWAFETSDGNLINEDEYNEAAALTTAREVARLLKLSAESKAYIKHKDKYEQLKPADFAVLCRKTKEAFIVKKYLDQLGIANIISSSKSIFDSEEAYEIHLLLNCISEPGNLNMIKNFLITDLMGFKPHHVKNMEESEGLGGYSIKLRGYKELLISRGIMHCVNEFLKDEQIISRLIHSPYGKRKIANINQLSEILHKKESENALQLHELINWLSNQRSGNLLKEEEYELRMETDEDALNIMTIHKSKGLQFPVVFAPFLLAGSLMHSFKPFIYHDDDLEMYLQLESDEETQRKYALECLSENLRLAYVALTRAKYRCYTALAKTRNAGTSAFAYLFSDGDIFSKEWKKEFNNKISMENFVTEALDNEAFDFIDILPAKLESADINSDFEPSESAEELSGEEKNLRVREFQNKAPERWKISSFSSILRKMNPHETFTTFMDDEVFDVSEISEEKRDADYSMFSLPGGVNTGNALHDLLEHTDLNTVTESGLNEIVRKTLNLYHIDAKFKNAVCENINNLRKKNLGGEKDFQLKNVPYKDTLREMEFYFPSRSIDINLIRDVFIRNAGEGETESIIAGSVGEDVSEKIYGFMKGYIDMIFRYNGRYYIIDWKTNYLGSTYEDYCEDSLNQAMLKSQYFLQYHIYTVALTLHLNSKMENFDYERHFGGVYYLFLRGIDAGENSRNGIFFHKPAQSVIAGLIESFQIEPVFSNGGTSANP